MNTLLMVAVVVITLAVIAQAGVLIGMYLTTQRITKKAEGIMDDGKRLMVPLESVTSNLKTVSEDLTETGKLAREQVGHVQGLVSEAQTAVRDEIAEARTRIRATVDEASRSVVKPFRQFSAIGVGIATGIRTFLFGKPKQTDVTETIIINDQRPAA
jgi:hypothetical protein